MAIRPETSVEFIDWIEHNPDGFYVNLNTSGPRLSILHRAHCPHIYPPGPDTNYIAYKKMCSQDAEGLMAIAKSEGHTVSQCQTCQPF